MLQADTGAPPPGKGCVQQDAVKGGFDIDIFRYHDAKIHYFNSRMLNAKKNEFHEELNGRCALRNQVN
jgi:hypothetical protein